MADEAERVTRSVPTMATAQSSAMASPSAAQAFSSCSGAAPSGVQYSGTGSCVYFLSCEDHPLVKIGSTTGLADRIADLQQGCPYELRLLVAIEGDITLEKKLHLQFGMHRVRGEWFRLDGGLRALIDALLAGQVLPAPETDGLLSPTRRQLRVLQAIVDSIARHGRPPSFREIAASMGITSTNGISDHMHALESKGLLKRDHMRARGTRVTDLGMQALRRGLPVEHALRDAQPCGEPGGSRVA